MRKRSTRRQQGKAGSSDVTQRLRGESAATASSTTSYDDGPDHEALSTRYGLNFVRDGQAQKVQRLESEFGSDRVGEWVDEGMAVETMGKPQDMQAFRQRQEARSDVIPADVERRNQASVQRSAQAAHDDGPAGEVGVPDTVRNVISTPGKSLDESVQREMESKIGDDFSDVQLHTGPAASAAADAINARAFTVGNHVAFNDGEYDPHSKSGKRVLAHELTHVRQQTGGRVSMLPRAGGGLEIDPDPRLEREAETVADRVVSSEGAADGGFHVQRQPGDSTVQRFPFPGSESQQEADESDENESGSATVGMTESELEEFVSDVANAAIPEGVPEGVNRLVFHVHGFHNDAEDGLDIAQTARNEYESAGLEGAVSGLGWDAGSTAIDWWSANERARELGPQLATFIRAYKERYPETDIVLQGHSLGTRVILEAVRALAEQGETDVVDTVVMFAGAVDSYEVSKDGKYGDALSSAVNNVENYFSTEDGVLNWVFWMAEMGKEAIGNAGGAGDLPENYTDHDVSEVIDGHSSLKYIEAGFLETRVVPGLSP